MVDRAPLREDLESRRENASRELAYFAPENGLPRRESASGPRRENECNFQICQSGKIDPLHGFAEFWEVYGHKKARAKCESIWVRKKLAVNADQVIAGARAYVANRGGNPRYWKHPEGWLNAERWTDEYAPLASAHSDTFDAIDQAASMFSGRASS